LCIFLTLFVGISLGHGRRRRGRGCSKCGGGRKSFGHGGGGFGHGGKLAIRPVGGGIAGGLLAGGIAAAAPAVIGAGAKILGGILSGGNQQQQANIGVGSSGGANIGIGSNLFQHQSANIGIGSNVGVGGCGGGGCGGCGSACGGFRFLGLGGGGGSQSTHVSNTNTNVQSTNIEMPNIQAIIDRARPRTPSFRSLSIGEKEVEPSPPKDDPHVRTGKSEKGGYHVWIGNPGKAGEDGINRETGVFERHVVHGPITANVKINQ